MTKKLKSKSAMFLPDFLLGSSFLKSFDKYIETDLQLMQVVKAPTINGMMRKVLYNFH